MTPVCCWSWSIHLSRVAEFVSPQVIGWAARDQTSHIESGLVVQYGPNELRARRVLATSADKVDEWQKSSIEGFGISDMVVQRILRIRHRLLMWKEFAHLLKTESKSQQHVRVLIG